MLETYALSGKIGYKAKDKRIFHDWFPWKY